MKNAPTDANTDSDVEVEIDLSTARSLIANMTFDSNDMVVDLLATLAPFDRQASDDLDVIDVDYVDDTRSHSDLDVRAPRPTA